MDTMARARPYRCGLLLLASFLGPACLLHQQADRHAADDAAHGQSQEWSMRRRLHKVKSRRRLRPGSHSIHLRPRELSSPADGPPLLRFAVYSDTHYWVRSSTRSRLGVDDHPAELQSRGAPQIRLKRPRCCGGDIC